MRLVLGLGAGLAVAWILLLATLVVVRPAGMDLREATRFLPDVRRAHPRPARDRSLGRRIRAPVLVLLACLASPVDLVPDFVPGIGYADDVSVAVAVLRLVLRRAGAVGDQRAVAGHAQGLAVLLRLLQRRGGGG